MKRLGKGSIFTNATLRRSMKGYVKKIRSDYDKPNYNEYDEDMRDREMRRKIRDIKDTVKYID